MTTPSRTRVAEMRAASQLLHPRICCFHHRCIRQSIDIVGSSSIIRMAPFLITIESSFTSSVFGPAGFIVHDPRLSICGKKIHHVRGLSSTGVRPALLCLHTYVSSITGKELFPVLLLSIMVDCDGFGHSRWTTRYTLATRYIIFSIASVKSQVGLLPPIFSQYLPRSEG